MNLALCQAMSTGRDTRLQNNSLEHYSDNRTAFQIMKAVFLVADKQYSYLLSKTPCCCCSVLKVNLTGPDVTAVFNFSTEKILIHHSQKVCIKNEFFLVPSLVQTIISMSPQCQIA